MEWPFEDTATVPIIWHQPGELGQDFPGAAYALDQSPVYDKFSPIARIHRSRNQGVKGGIVPLIIIPSDPLGRCLLSVSQS